MKVLSAFFITIFLSFSVLGGQTKIDKSVTLEKLKNVNLLGMKVLEKQTKADSFGYKLLAARSIDATNAQIIKDTYGGSIISRLFVLGEQSAFKNILVFIGKSGTDGRLQVVIIYVNQSSSFVVDLDITKVEEKKIHANNGPKGEEDLYEVVATNLFPKK